MRTGIVSIGVGSPQPPSCLAGSGKPWGVRPVIATGTELQTTEYA